MQGDGIVGGVVISAVDIVRAGATRLGEVMGGIGKIKGRDGRSGNAREDVIWLSYGQSRSWATTVQGYGERPSIPFNDKETAAQKGAISMRWIIGGVFVLLLAVFEAGYGRAQDIQWQELEAFTAWARDARSFYAETDLVGREIDVAESLIEDHVAGAVSKAAMQAEVEAALRRTSVSIDAISAALEDGLERPDISDERLRSAADTFATYLESIDDELREQHRITRALLEAALSEDWATYDLVTARSLRHAARSLRAEGTVHSITMQMQDPRSPTHALSRSIIALYEPTAIQLEMLAAYVDGQAVDFSTAYSLIEGSVFVAERAIEDGEVATRGMHRQAEAARADSSMDPALGEFLSRSASSFDRSFRIERRLLEIMSEFQILVLERLGTAMPLDDPTIARMSELMVEMEAGVAERFDEQSRRLADLQSLSAVMRR